MTRLLGKAAAVCVFITYRIRLKEVMEGVDPHTARLVILHQAEGGCRDTTIDPS